jgi:hypothetical protein
VKINISKSQKDGASSLIKKYGFIAVSIILMLLLLRQCNITSDAEKEGKRQYNNLLASQDSVRFISNKLGNAVYEKSAFEFKMSELSKENKDLIQKLDLDKKRTPEVVIQTVTKYIEIFKDVPTKINEDSLGNRHIDFIHNPKLPGSNSLTIKGKIPFDIKLNSDPKDPSRVLPSLLTGNAEIKMEQSISIVTGLYRDPKSKRLMTRVSTDYPGITFTDINSFQIQDTPEMKKTLRSERKIFGIGLNAGVGYVVGNGKIGPGAYIGIGFHLSPRFLQSDLK